MYKEGNGWINVKVVGGEELHFDLRDYKYQDTETELMFKKNYSHDVMVFPKCNILYSRWSTTD